MTVSIDSYSDIDDAYSAACIDRPSDYAGSIEPSSEKSRQQYGLHTVKDCMVSCSSDDKFNAAFFVASLARTNEELNRQYISLFKEDIESDLEELKDLDEKKLEALKEHAIKVNSASTWEAMKNVASYFAYFSSSIIGWSACANPTLSTILLISGLGGTVNRVLSDIGVWKSIASYFYKEEETQDKVARYVDNGFSVVATGLGLFNVLGGCCFGTEILLYNGSKEMIKRAGQYGSTMLSSVASYKYFETKSKQEQSKAVLTEAEGKHIDRTKEMENKMTVVDQLVKDDSTLMEKAHSIINSIIENLRKLTQR